MQQRPALMRRLWRSGLIRLGALLLVGGSAPLLLILAAAAIGIGDPNPNPIGPGLLAFVTFWPGVICLVGGVLTVIVRGARAAAPPE